MMAPMCIERRNLFAATENDESSWLLIFFLLGSNFEYLDSESVRPFDGLLANLHRLQTTILDLSY